MHSPNYFLCTNLLCFDVNYILNDSTTNEISLLDDQDVREILDGVANLRRCGVRLQRNRDHQVEAFYSVVDLVYCLHPLKRRCIVYIRANESLVEAQQLAEAVTSPPPAPLPPPAATPPPPPPPPPPAAATPPPPPPAAATPPPPPPAASPPPTTH
ncbi:uncharacterized protein LOC142333236 [Lycorma delicatula]|uniref:uncharacterized protein LOC142333236 n=1 Tax=Lycorma delicatula TaxID=130591 RepID=UPI003F511C30